MNTALRETDWLLKDAVIAEAVQLIEQTGPLDDAAAMREAALIRSSPAGRVAHRAAVLGERIGLHAELLRARHWAPWVGLGLVVVVVIAGLSLAGNVVGGSERRINIMVALVSLLGVHLLTLLLWLAGLVLPLTSFNTSLGWLWMALTARVAGGKRGQAPVLLRASTQLLGRARLVPWAFGFVSHCIWALSFAAVLGALLFALAFRSYTLSWETTILEPGFFVNGVKWLGWAPGLLGFPVPDASTVLTPIAGQGEQRDWALWLTGCIVTYGLLPRFFFAVISALVWQRRKRHLQPDLTQPYYVKLLARLSAMAPATIVDGDPGFVRGRSPVGLGAGEASDKQVLVGFELPEETPWPPAGLPPSIAPVLHVDGSAGQRHAVLATIGRLRPRTLLVACHAASSPDRGTERLLRELLAHCGECRLWLMAGDEAARGRWRRWLGDVGLDCIKACDNLAATLADA
ncbi:DUF2868 domain-containing protein [Variovorax rhizosphaerae]|uniref:DUF2868 domain-containing protein n=1 Tax=Variovorax rhizosphaerae TaxID=1836200 RepID=A0ABU8WV77_9BURK